MFRRLSFSWMFLTHWFVFESHSMLVVRYGDVGQLLFAAGTHLYICLLGSRDDAFGGSAFGGDVAVCSLILWLHRQLLCLLWHWLSRSGRFHLKTCCTVTPWCCLVENVHRQSAMDGHRLVGWLTGAQTAEYHCTRWFIHALELSELVVRVVLETCSV